MIRNANQMEFLQRENLKKHNVFIFLPQNCERGPVDQNRSRP